MTRPAVKLDVSGKDIKLSRFVSAEYVDNTGRADDRLNIVFSDYDNALEIPDPDSRIKIWAGTEKEMVYWGEWVCNDYTSVSHKSLTINCKPYSDMLLRSYSTKRYNESFETIVKEIASRNGMKAVIYKDFRNYKSESFTQKNESDLNFLTRICKEYGAYFKVIEGRICILKRCSGLNAEGKSLDVIDLDISDIKKNGISVRGGRRKKYKSCEVFYADPYHQKTERIIKGSGDPKKRISEAFRSKKEAEIAADSFLKDYNSSMQTAEVNMIDGCPELRSESPVMVRNHKPETDGLWFAESVTHKIDARKITTNAKLIRNLE